MHVIFYRILRNQKLLGIPIAKNQAVTVGGVELGKRRHQDQ
ncbi:hypothetical protein [Dubosiella newyorkensis]